MSVAPSFQNLKLIGEPFEENKKEYIYVEYADGHQRKVRWYPESFKKIRPTKDVLGFQQGYINLVKGDTYPYTEWLRESDAVYRTCWGWAFETGANIPERLPEGLSLVELPWDRVADVEKDELKSKPEIDKVLNELLYDPGTSEWQGQIGERIDRTLTVVRTIELESGYYGASTLHLFTDEAGNEYCWTTAAKKLEAGRTYKVRGSIKNLQTYHNKKQTVLTRCKITD